MKDDLAHLDWSLLQCFVAVAETGSLSAAARRLGSSQPTVGRQVRDLEAQLDVALFTRHQRGLELSPNGEALLPHALQMQDGMRGFGLAAAGRSEHLSGPVRITASVFTAQHILPAIIARIRREEPQISIDLVPTDATENLLYREADIAVRMFRTEQLDIITQFQGELAIGVFAAQSYLDRVGVPASLEEMMALDFVGYDRSDLILRGMRAAGIEVTRDFFATRTDHHAVYWELVKAGCGVGYAQRWVGQQEPGIVQLVPEMAIPGLPLWLAAHEAMRQTPRIRRVWEILKDGLAPYVS